MYSNFQIKSNKISYRYDKSIYFNFSAMFLVQLHPFSSNYIFCKSTKSTFIKVKTPWHKILTNHVTPCQVRIMEQKCYFCLILVFRNLICKFSLISDKNLIPWVKMVKHQIRDHDYKTEGGHVIEVSAGGFTFLKVNGDMFSWLYFQVPVSFTVIGSIASSTLKFMHNTRHKVVR